MSLVSLWLAGCSDTSNPPAPVSSVNGNAPANTNSGMLITPPPKMGTTSTAQQPQIQPVQQPQIQATQQPQIQPVQPVAQQPVQMENGRIVYNRQYGNIPKGSYSGSTSTSTPISTWRWPTEGKVIETFGASEGGNKGIDIAGSKGQAIIATADGRVVYAGNALRGYGNLIIIKHNDDYLSAYAHNDTMLVREQQEVKAGQKIATMGSTGTSSTRLHFEIRYKGKSVNPLRYLPQR
ncbi:murein hydrolase activator NlpD [Escherichia coli]|uniref:murein hydrolase activator NlpD n=1 Tax=Escherichia coli TaxID=562 RepID=UPI00295E6CB3|nr:murein hydrolase activator NlpD [Escherichia coli]